MKARNVLILIALVLTTLWIPVTSSAQSGSNDATFNPDDNGRGAGPNLSPTAMVVQADGKIIIGGNFTRYNNTDVNRIARINTDGSYDATFTKGDGFNAAVTALAVQSDGKIIVAGNFVTYNSQSIDRIARLNTDGTLDGTFTPGATYTDIRSISIQSDGKIVIAGGFTPNRIARLNSNGSADASFVPGTGADNAINSVVVQSDGKIIIAGTFANYNGTARNRVARLTSTGGLDAAFDPGSGPDNTINVAAVQSDGRVLIGGTFTTFGGTARRQLARLTTTGTLDATFTPDIITQASAVVNSIAIQSNGMIVIGGFFTVNGSSASHFDRLNANGTLDNTLVRGSGADNTINVVAIKSDGSFVLAGAFQSFASTFKINVAQVLSDGNIDTAFNPVTGLLGPVNVIVQQPDGKILVGGNFAIYNNEARRNIMRLNEDGSLDASSVGTLPGATSIVTAIALQSDGKIIIGGNFGTYQGASRNRIARLNTNGTNDATFTPGTGANNNITALAIQSDGKIIISGAFTSYNGTTINRIARLNSDGTLDATFNPGAGPSAGAKAIAIQSDGKIIIGGTFTSYDGVTKNGIARLNTNGSLDATFAGTGATTINAIKIQPDNQILIAGSFSSYNGTAANGIVRLNTDGTLDPSFNSGAGVGAGEILSLSLQTSGKIVIGGTFTTYNGTTRNKIAMLSTSGSLDTSFDPGTGAGTGNVNAVAVQSDGNIMLGGTFTTYNGATRSRIARATVLSCSTPPAPGTISGTATICPGTSNTYSIAAVGGATSYTWTLPSGWTGTSTTTSINATAGTTGGNITVTANNGCGSSAASVLAITVSASAPAQPGTITGDAVVCSGAAETYSIAAVTGATSYTWTLPGGWTGTSTTTSVNATPGATSGNISVVANNSCGTSTARTLAVTVSAAVAAQPGTITGDAAVCSGASETYSVAAVSGATSYTWTLPSGWTGTSTTNSINVTTGTTGGNISVTANNGCGSSAATVLAATVSASAPAQPGTITGDAVVCSGAAKTYSITAVSGATSYTWTLPGGWTGTSTTTSINVTPGATSGNISVVANNTCGSSTARTLAVTVSGGVPAQPGAITGDAAVCSGVAKTYSVAAVSGATSYTWTLPSGWTGTSTTNSISVTTGSSGGNVSVTANNICGSSTARTLAVAASATPAQPGTITGDNVVCSATSKTYSIAAVSGAITYTWTLPTGWTGTSTTNAITVTTGTSSGNISVTANNTCGTSTARTLAVTANIAPAQPGTITGDATTCSGVSKTYSVAAVTGATSYTWTLPGGWTGTSTTNSITATASATAGNISVIANNACGSSTARTLAVTITTMPAQPGAITGDASICSGATRTYSIEAVANATSYTWTLPGGWTGTSTSTSISATASSTSGNISVTANSSCGSSTARTLAVTAKPTPAKPVINVDNTNPQALILSTASADSYTWFQDGEAAGTTQTLEVSTSGDYTVKVTTNGCESVLSDPKTITITGINDEELRAMNIFPNPVSEWLVISLEGIPGKKTISVYDINGKRPLSEVTTGDMQAKLSVRDFATGIYLVMVKTDRVVKVMRFSKE